MVSVESAAPIQPLTPAQELVGATWLVLLRIGFIDTDLDIRCAVRPWVLHRDPGVKASSVFASASVGLWGKCVQHDWSEAYNRLSRTRATASTGAIDCL